VLMVVLVVGFPVALALAWFFELTPSGVAVDHGAAGAPRPAVTGMRRYADIAIIGILVVIVAVLVADKGGLIEETPGERVVAVLPFENLSPEAADAYFGEGLADTLIHKLGQLGELVVLASQSTFQFTGRNLDLNDVGAKLGATVIMLGSVQRAGNALRVNARLVEVGSGKQLWSGSYDRGVQDVFAVQDEIAAAVTGALRLVLAPEAKARLATQATSSLSAYETYVLGTARLAARAGDDLERALEYFRQAIEADPDYALAHAGLVEALYLKSSQHSPPQELLDRWRLEALQAANKAMELAPGLGETWLARAQVAEIERDLFGSRELSDQDIAALFEKAIELSPSHALAHKYLAIFRANRFGITDERAIQLLLKASQLDPRSGIIKVNLGHIYWGRREFERAEDMFRQAVRTREPYFRLGFRSLVDFHLSVTGRLDEAARWARAWKEMGPTDNQAKFAYVYVLMNLGAWEEARAVRDELTAAQRDQVGTDLGSIQVGLWLMDMLLARASGDLETAHAVARQLSTDFWEKSGAWPVMQANSTYSRSIAAFALYETNQGRTGEALTLYLAAYPGPFEKMDLESLDVMNPVVMMAALLKRDGEHERATSLLKDFMAFLDSREFSTPAGQIGFMRFTILAMLGETGQALDTLQAAMESGYLEQWYALKDGAFDPDYAAVVADPRFEELYARITARVDDFRAAFFANPELPEGYLP